MEASRAKADSATDKLQRQKGVERVSPELETFLDFNQGTDPELLAARNRIHEPSERHPFCGEFINVPLFPGNTTYIPETYSEWTQVKVVTFERDEVRSPGCCFWVWRAVRDGKIYL